MSRAVRGCALLVVLVLVAASCSRPKEDAAAKIKASDKKSSLDAPNGTEAPAVTDVQVETTVPDPSSATTAPKGAKQKVETAQQGYGALNPGADRTHAQKVGALIKLQSTAFPRGNPRTWAGVEQRSIKLAFSIDLSNCGVNVINAISQAGGNFSSGSRFYRPAPRDQQTNNDENRESVETLVKYWNENVARIAADIPAATQVMDRLNAPGHLFYGRKMVAEIVDGGSFQCPEKTTAAAVKIAQEIKPFAVFTNDTPGIDGSGYNMAAALNAKAPASSRPMHFGSLWLSDGDYRRWAPFAWTQFNSGTAAARHTASWVCTRLRNQNAVNSPQYKDTKRKFALLYPNADNARAVANDFKVFVQQYCGEPVTTRDTEFDYTTDVAQMPDQASQVSVKCKLLNCTSLIYFMDFLFPLFEIVASKGQGYRPERVWTGTGYQDSSTVQRLFDQEMVDRTSIGISAFGVPGGFGYGAGDPFWAYHALHKVSPKTGKACDPASDEGMMHDPVFCRAPGAIVTWYYSFLPFIGGLIFAGPDLTPQHVTGGLQAYPLTRYSPNGPTDDPRPALVGAGPNQYHFIVDATEWRWRAKFKSPPPESKLGWVEWTDCQRHYVVWPDQLAPQWERNGPNYNAWCGGEQHAPADSPEKDGYPKWQPELAGG